jgi:1,4-alpha-glucan branching enzyme
VFLDAVAREIHRLGGGIERVSPSEHLERFPWLERSMPAESTWGEGGHLSVWLDEATNAWIQPRLTRASRRLDALVQGRRGPRATEAVRRLRRQAERELLLAEASDWPFLMQRGTAGDYPRRRVESHLDRLEAILQLLESTPSPRAPAWLDDLESRHNLFPGPGPAA